MRLRIEETYELYLIQGDRRGGEEGERGGKEKLVSGFLFLSLPSLSRNHYYRFINYLAREQIVSKVQNFLYVPNLKFVGIVNGLAKYLANFAFLINPHRLKTATRGF